MKYKFECSCGNSVELENNLCPDKCDKCGKEGDFFLDLK